MPRCPIIYDPQHTIFCVEMVTCIGRWWYRNWYLSIPYEAPGRPPNPGGWPNPGGAPNPPPAGPPKLGGGGGISSMRLPPPPGGGGSGGETTTKTKEISHNLNIFLHFAEIGRKWSWKITKCYLSEMDAWFSRQCNIWELIHRKTGDAGEWHLQKLTIDPLYFQILLMQKHEFNMVSSANVHTQQFLFSTKTQLTITHSSAVTSFRHWWWRWICKIGRGH